MFKFRSEEEMMETLTRLVEEEFGYTLYNTRRFKRYEPKDAAEEIRDKYCEENDDGELEVNLNREDIWDVLRDDFDYITDEEIEAFERDAFIPEKDLYPRYE